MRKIILPITVFFLFSVICSAQPPEEKKTGFNHYIGLQVNFLLKQILNFSESNSVNDNPYLLTYGLYSAKKGWGIATGIGLDVKNVSDKGFPGEVGSKNYDFYFRVGPGRIVKLRNKFEAGFNVNFIYNIHRETSFSSLVTDFGLFTDSTATNVNHKISGSGIGGQGNLIFHFTDQVMIGTEAAINYIRSVDKKTNTVFTIHSNNLLPENTQMTEITVEQADTETYKLYAPVAIYLIVKF